MKNTGMTLDYSFVAMSFVRDYKNALKRSVRRYQKSKNYRTKTNIRFAMLVATLLIMFGIFRGNAMISDAADQNLYYKYYMTYTVEQGDNLYSYATRFGECQKADAYIEEVMRLNHLDDEKIISGVKLVLPYYTQSPIQ